MFPRRQLTFTFALVLALSCISVGQQPVRSAETQESAADLDRMIKEFEYAKLARAVAELPASPERDYFAGVLANREGRVDDSIALLKKVLPQLKASNPDRTAVALLALGDDYIKTYRYNDAIATYDDLLRNFASHLDKAERQSTQDDYEAVRLLKDAPAQTISFDGPVDVPIHRNAILGTIDAMLTVNGVTESWILDTGANITAITASFAKRLGLTLSKGKAQTQGITGAENDLRVAMLPELRLGSATVRDVAVIVLNDSSFNVQSGKKSRYQINAVLGYPVLHALQKITFTKDGHLLAGPSSPSAENGARMYMKQLTPLLECAVQGRKILFSFDTGANGTMFSVRYAHEFANQLNGIQKRKYGMGGAGGIRKMDAYYLPHPQLVVGATTVEMQDIPVLAPLGTDADKLFGNIGRDLTDPYASFTIDFTNMRLQLGEKLPEKAAASPQR